MLSWEDIVQGYIIRYSDQIKKVTQPLRDHFGIRYFTYHQIDEMGKYTVLVDRPDWAEYYVEEKIYRSDPYLRHPKVYGSGFCLLESHGTKEYKKKIFKGGQAVLNADLGVLLIQKKENSVEFFGFAANKESSFLNSIYLNHPQLLKSFARHFKSELAVILAKMSKEAGSLLEMKGCDFLCEKAINAEIDRKTRFAFLKDVGLNAELKCFERLSKREKECLKWLVAEKSAKETAFILGLSRRTVESYFESIKNKFSCDSKQELLTIARNIKQLDLL